jgi:hypothetical protein
MLDLTVRAIFCFLQEQKIEALVPKKVIIFAGLNFKLTGAILAQSGFINFQCFSISRAGNGLKRIEISKTDFLHFKF